MTHLDIRKELVDQMDFAWEYHFLHRMSGTTDAEFLWAPVGDVWTVHAGTDGGADTIDPQMQADPAPFTTLAWRMWHMTDFFTQRWVSHFGDPATDEMHTSVVLTFEDALANLTAAYERWKNALMTMPEERLSSPCGPAEHHFAHWPFASLMLHINREFIHHAAECCLIRDLYRQKDSFH